MAEQKAKVVKVGRGGPRGPRPKVQNPGKIFMRILRYVMECYRIQVVAGPVVREHGAVHRWAAVRDAVLFLLRLHRGREEQRRHRDRALQAALCLHVIFRQYTD